MQLIANNKKAYHDFEILEKLEAGIELVGSEVKALRLGRANLKDSFVRIVKDEAILFGAHITHIATANPHYRPEEKRPRKLLMHRKEIDKWVRKVKQDGLAIVPLRLYFNEKNRAKVQIGLGRGKKLHDKRETLKQKTMQRDIQSAIKEKFR